MSTSLHPRRARSNRDALCVSLLAIGVREAKLTYVFPRVSGNVTPVKLVLSEHGKQTGVFELPK